jgi:GT2 family glycosyltransferase
LDVEVLSEIPIVLAMPYHSLRNGALARSLESVSKINYPKEFTSLILVDNVSFDGAKEFVELWLKKYGKSYRAVHHFRESGNLPKLRNLCLNLALKENVEYLVFVDSDVIVTQDFINRLLNIYKSRIDREELFVVSIPYWAPPEKLDVFSRFRIKYEGLKPAFGIGIKEFDTVNLGASMINMALVPKVGLLDEEISILDDLDYTRRATSMGYKAIYDTSITFFHDKHVKTLPYLKQVLFKEGRPEAKLLLNHRQLLRKSAKSLIFWNLFLISLPLTIISAVPFFVLFFIGYIRQTLVLRGIGKIIGFPILLPYKIAKSLGTTYGLIYYLIKGIKLR